MTELTGTGALTRLALRRDRWLIGVTAVGLALLVYWSMVATRDLYPSVDQLREAARASEASPAVVAMYGHVHDLSSVGGIGSLKMIMFGAVTCAFLAIAVVRRHTRADEESGRYELLGAGCVGRYAALTAAVVVALLASLLCGALGALACIGAGLPVGGSLLLGGAFAAGGVAFTGLTAVLVQLTESNRTAGTMAFVALALAFALRAVGDLQVGRPLSVLTWLSPLGWAQQTRPYQGDRLFPLALPVLLLLVCLALAFALLRHRDPGHGVLATRPGRARGRIGSVAGLARRLHRGPLLAWSAGFILMGLLLGALADSVGGFVTGGAEDYLRKLGGAGSVGDLYLTLMASITGMVAAACGIGTALRLRSEEDEHHAEYLLAAPVSRAALLASHAVAALLATVAGPALAGAVAATLRCARAGDWSLWGRTFGALLAPAPAALVLTALAVCAVGALPRWASALAWGVLGLVIALDMFGGLLGLPDAALRLSPFRNVPRYPAEAWSPVSGVVPAALAAALTAAGFWALRRRDLR